MEVKINKEIRDYQEGLFFGLTMRQCVFSVLAIGAAVGTYFLLKQVIRSLCESCPSYAQRKGTFSSPKMEGCRGESEGTELALVSCLLTPFFVPSNFPMTLHSASKLT